MCSPSNSALQDMLKFFGGGTSELSHDERRTLWNSVVCEYVAETDIEKIRSLWDSVTKTQVEVKGNIKTVVQELEYSPSDFLEKAKNCYRELETECKIIPSGGQEAVNTLKILLNKHKSDSVDYGRLKFRKLTFEHNLCFDFFIFPWHTMFFNCKFNKVSFNFSLFLGNLCIDNSRFKDKFMCYKTHFNQMLLAPKCQFIGEVFIHGIQFNYWVNFSQSQFLNLSRFEKCTFLFGIDFRDCFFKRRTDFNQSCFKGAPLFQSCKFHSDTVWTDVKWKYILSASEIEQYYLDLVGSRKDKDSPNPKISTYPQIDVQYRGWRSARIIMEEQGDFSLSCKLFIQELDYRTQLEVAGKAQGGQIRCRRRVLYLLYLHTSFCGTSATRPLIWLIIIFLLGIPAYNLLISDLCHSKILIASKLSLSSILAVSSPALNPKAKISWEEEFSIYHSCIERVIDVYVQLVSLIQTGLGLTLLFLIFLGLRSQLKITK